MKVVRREDERRKAEEKMEEARSERPALCLEPLEERLALNVGWGEGPTG